MYGTRRVNWSERGKSPSKKSSAWLADWSLSRRQCTIQYRQAHFFGRQVDAKPLGMSVQSATESAAYSLRSRTRVPPPGDPVRSASSSAAEPEVLMNEAKIDRPSSLRSARIPEPSMADRSCRGDRRPAARHFRAAKGQVALLRFALELRSWRAAPGSTKRASAIRGPRAAARRSWRRQSRSGRDGVDTIGLNIVLPHEQLPNV